MILWRSPWTPSHWRLFLHQGSSQIARNVRISTLGDYNPTDRNKSVHFIRTTSYQCIWDTGWYWEIRTPNIWRRSGSLKRNGMLETCRRFGWALLDPSSSLPLPAPPPDDTDTLRDWGSEVKGAKTSSWQGERVKIGGEQRSTGERWQIDGKEEEEEVKERTQTERRKWVWMRWE